MTIVRNQLLRTKFLRRNLSPKPLPMPKPLPATPRPSQTAKRSLDLLASIRPNSAAAFEATLLHSRRAMKLVDRWLGLECTALLESGQPSNDGGSLVRIPDVPLAHLLATAGAGSDWTGIDDVKALLVVGYAYGRIEHALVDLIANGARRSARKDEWKQVMPTKMADDATLFSTIQACRNHAKSGLDEPGNATATQIKWLDALERWCTFLAEPPSKLRWILNPVASGPELKPPPDEIEPDPPKRPASFSLHDDDDIDHWPVEVGLVLAPDDGPELPTSAAPEAPRSVPRALPPREGEPETAEGGDARGARTGFRSALENQRLRWVNDQLVDRDFANLVLEVRGGLKSIEPLDADAAGVIGLALVLGLMVEQVVALPASDHPGRSHLVGAQYLSRWVPPAAGGWTPGTAQGELLQPHADRLLLRLPVELAEWLDARTGTEAAQELGDALGQSPVEVTANVRRWLEGVRQRTRGMQTLGRIERWLPNVLYQHCRDHVLVHHLCASPESPSCPASYYRAYPQSEVEELHARVLESAGWTLVDPPGASIGTKDPAWIGTRLNPEIDVVAKLWKSTTEHFERLAGDTSQPLHLRHNARETHEVMALMFQTFHRAVSDPIESLEILDLEVGRALLDDKQQGDARAHRLVPLTALGVAQCTDHIEHLWRLAVAVQSQAPTTTQQIVAMLSYPEAGVIPFRFFLDADLRIVRITPGGLRDAVAGVWTLPLNLARHFGSTWLLERGASDAQVTSLMGHHDLGTLELSILSPKHFDALFSGVVTHLNEWVGELGLRSIPSFLAPIEQRPPAPALSEIPEKMSFGHRRRARNRAAMHQFVEDKAKSWIVEQLAGRKPSALKQHDVAALFETARRASANGRSHWARQRFEAVRNLLLGLLRENPDLKLELPAIAISIRDVAHVCPMDGLAAGAWLKQVQAALAHGWATEFFIWRKAQSASYVPDVRRTVLTAIIESLVIDPDVWKVWFAKPMPFNVFLDQFHRPWLRMPLPSGNSRLYPLSRALAELLAGVEAGALRSLKPEHLTATANKLLSKSKPASAIGTFGQLLSRIQSAMAPDVPGLVLGYADGSCGSVSLEEMCLERLDGAGPTVSSVRAWHDARVKPEKEDAHTGLGTVRGGKDGALSGVAAFRRAMSEALALLEDRRGKKSKRANTALDGEKTDSSSNLGPLNRFKARLDARWNDLVASSSLPPICAFAAHWMHHLAENPQAGGDPYAPKTLRNYWYSWALRLVEEMEDIDPRELAPEEFEELYLQIVEDAEVVNRQHLYPPLRNLHRYLVMAHGVCDIDWTDLKVATDQGVKRIDANMVHHPEYRHALDLLRDDRVVSPRIAALQSTALVLLYRCGMRINEVLGLRDSDIYFHDGRWHVRVAGNRFRMLKTDNSRRTIVVLEALESVEAQALASWSEHVKHFASGRFVKPLFAAGTTGEERAELIPRRTIALRIGQALRLATRDPSTRIHHCRHGYSTRLLQAGLDVDPPGAPMDKKAVGARRALGALIRDLLTSEDDPTRRLIWALATMMGHASPATTLRTYFHGGLEMLARWHAAGAWRAGEGIKPVEWHVFAAGVKLKTMQRLKQRAGMPLALPTTEAEWTRLRRVGDGPRARMAGRLPPLTLQDGTALLVNADKVIDHVRRFGRVDGLADSLFVDERWVEQVVRAADEQARRWRVTQAAEGFSWFDDGTVIYSAHQVEEVEAALMLMSGIDAKAMRDFGDLLRKRLHPQKNMVSVESVEELERLSVVIQQLVDQPSFIKILIPGRADYGDIAPVVAGATAAAGRRLKPVTEGGGVRRKPRRTYALVEGLEKAAAIAELGREMGFATGTFGRVVAAKDSSHARTHSGDRAGLTIGQNDTDRLRSAKAFTRTMAVAAVVYGS